MAVPIARRMQRAASGGNLRQRRRGLRNITGGPTGGIETPRPPIPGQTPPINRPLPGQTPPIVPQAAPLTGLALALSRGNLPDRFSGGFKIGENNGKIIDTTYGNMGPAHDAKYQKLFNAAQAAGLNITGGSGQGGAYDPLNIYARGGNHMDFVDLNTGRIAPPSTGGSGNDYNMVNPELLARLQANSGFTAERAAGSANAGAMAGVPRQTAEQFAATNGYAPTVQQPQTQPGQPQGPKPTVANPQSAFENGKDPGKHAAYWADKGWHQNDATGVWHGPNGQQWDQTPTDKPNQTGGQGGGPTNDPNGPQSPGAPGTQPAPGSPAQPGAPTSNTLPLDPMYEAQRQQAQAQFDRQMSAISAAGLRLTNEQQVALARMATNEGVDVQQLMESLAGRGALQSSVYGDQRGLLATDYARQHQDLATSIADALGGLSTQAGDVQSGYESDLLDALYGTYGRALNDPNAMVDSYSTAPKKPRKRKRRGR